MPIRRRGFLLIAILPFVGIACDRVVPSGSYEVDTMKFVPTDPKSGITGPAPGVWIDTNVKISGRFGGTIESKLPYGLALDYTDTRREYRNAELTRITVTYDDGTVEPAAKALKLPLEIRGREYESVNSVAGGRVVKTKLWLISGRVAKVIAKAEPFTLKVDGYLVKKDGSKVPFAIDQHFDVVREKSKRSALDVFRDV